MSEKSCATCRFSYEYYSVFESRMKLACSRLWVEIPPSRDACECWVCGVNSSLGEGMEKVIIQEVKRPEHYVSKSGKDVIDWLEDFGLMNNAYIFNVFKYLARAGKKNGNSELQDVLKAKEYIERYIKTLTDSGMETMETNGK